MVIANDTGSAINGAVRGDIFFGFGEEGEDNASYQYASGEYYLLVPIRIFKNGLKYLYYYNKKFIVIK